MEMDSPGMEELSRRFNDPEMLGTPVTSFMNQVAANFAGEITREAPHGADSELARGIEAELSFEKPFPKFIVITIRAFYARFVITGTKPHFPPWRPGSSLHRWARLKLRARNPDVAAFLIARHISIHGTKANDFVGRGIENGMGFYKRRIGDLAQEIARRMAGGK